MDKAADGSVPYRGKAVKPLTDKEQAAWRALMRLLIVLPRVIEADMIRAGQLTRSEYTVLMHLSEAEDRSMRMNALAELARLTESGMSRIVTRLGSEGLVERRRSSEDGRGQVVALTDKGLAQLEATFPGHLASVRHHVFDALTGVDLDSFTDALSRIAPDEPLAHLSTVEIPSRQHAAGEPGGTRRPQSPAKLRSILGIIAEHQDRQAQYLANQQVDDHEQHPASGHAEAVSIDEAVDRAGVLVLAVWLDAFEQLIAQYGGRLAGKVIVDPTNPVGPDGDGGYRKVIAEQESSGQILAGLLPPGARLVKAFGTLSAPTLSAAARREPERVVQFYAADHAAAGDLVRAGVHEPVRVGGLDQSIRIEMSGDLHEYGALGQVVTKSEAPQAIRSTLPRHPPARQPACTILGQEPAEFDDLLPAATASCCASRLPGDEPQRRRRITRCSAPQEVVIFA